MCVRACVCARVCVTYPGKENALWEKGVLGEYSVMLWETLGLGIYVDLLYVD